MWRDNGLKKGGKKKVEIIQKQKARRKVTEKESTSIVEQQPDSFTGHVHTFPGRDKARDADDWTGRRAAGCSCYSDLHA